MIDKQQKHNEVIRLYFEEGWSEERIGREVGVGHTTVNRWVAAYAKSQGKDKRDLRAEMGGTKSERVSAHEAERDKPASSTAPASRSSCSKISSAR